MFYSYDWRLKVLYKGIRIKAPDINKERIKGPSIRGAEVITIKLSNTHNSKRHIA